MGGGLRFAIDLTDTVSSIDAVLSSLITVISQIESITIAEARTALMYQILAVAESVAKSDNLSAGSYFVYDLLESLSLSDNIENLSSYYPILNEAITDLASIFATGGTALANRALLFPTIVENMPSATIASTRPRFGLTFSNIDLLVSILNRNTNIVTIRDANRVSSVTITEV